MQYIPLTQGKYTKVDNDDFDWLNQWKWFAHKNHRSDDYYAQRGKLSMARELLGLKKGDGKYADHINGDTLDNRKSNIRVVSHKQNIWNKKKAAGTTSKYRGVCWHKVEEKWMAYICKDNKGRHLGYFRKENQAAIVYNKAAKELFGEFARLNLIVK